MDGQTRLSLLKAIARSLVVDATRNPGEWHRPTGNGQGWPFDGLDQVIFEDGVYTVGFNGDYDDYCDTASATEALVWSWVQTFDSHVASGDVTQAEVDEFIRRKEYWAGMP